MTTARSFAGYLAAGIAIAGCFGAFGQAGPPSPETLQGISGCALEGSDVFISSGQGVDARRHKYQWSPAIDAICNAKGFAISAPAHPASQEMGSARSAAAVTTAAPANLANANEFPSSSRVLAPAELTQMLSGKVTKVIAGSGGPARVEYKPGGLVYFNNSAVNMSGRWRAEGSSVCYAWNASIPNNCTEMRIDGAQLYVKRQSGEVVKLEISER